MRITYAAVIALLLACTVSVAARAPGEWKPSRNVDIVVASAAAGSSDRTARVLQKLLQNNASFPSVTVTNRPGGGARRGILQLARVHRGTGLTPAQTAFWDQAFAKAIQAEDWKKDLAANAWAEDYMASADTKRHVDAEYEVMKAMLTDLGVVAPR